MQFIKFVVPTDNILKYFKIAKEVYKKHSSMVFGIPENILNKIKVAPCYNHKNIIPDSFIFPKVIIQRMNPVTGKFMVYINIINIYNFCNICKTGWVHLVCKNNCRISK